MSDFESEDVINNAKKIVSAKNKKYGRDLEEEMQEETYKWKSLARELLRDLIDDHNLLMTENDVYHGKGCTTCPLIAKARKEGL